MPDRPTGLRHQHRLVKQRQQNPRAEQDRPGDGDTMQGRPEHRDHDIAEDQHERVDQQRPDADADAGTPPRGRSDFGRMGSKSSAWTGSNRLLFRRITTTIGAFAAGKRWMRAGPAQADEPRADTRALKFIAFVFERSDGFLLLGTVLRARDGTAAAESRFLPKANRSGPAAPAPPPPTRHPPRSRWRGPPGRSGARPGCDSRACRGGRAAWPGSGERSARAYRSR